MTIEFLVNRVKKPILVVSKTGQIGIQTYDYPTIWCNYDKRELGIVQTQLLAAIRNKQQMFKRAYIGHLVYVDVVKAIRY